MEYAIRNVMQVHHGLPKIHLVCSLAFCFAICGCTKHSSPPVADHQLVDLGVIAQGDSRTMIIEIGNKTDSQIVVDKIIASCPCLTAKLSSQTLPPLGTRFLEISIEAGDKSLGRMSYIVEGKNGNKTIFSRRLTAMFVPEGDLRSID